MPAKKAGDWPVGSKPAALARPENLSEPETAAVSVRHSPSVLLVSGSNQPRHTVSWSGRETVETVLVWTVVTVAAALFLLGLCAALTIAWPA